MKICKHPDTNQITTGSLCGVMSYASFNRIISTMVRAGELRIQQDEFISGVEIGANGLAFQIEKVNNDNQPK